MNKCIYKYLRVSQDDDNAVESNSITSQRQIIDGYIASIPEFAGMTVKELSDDGYSGTNFNRPAVQRLLESVRKGEVSCIIVKDFSRFGRKYLEVSRFIEQIFPYLGVRFIALGDHYDSNNFKGTTADIDVPVRNMMNALYSRDVSKKIKSAKRTQLQNGVFSNAFAPYGYKKDAKDRHRLLIDETAAEIVRRIFTMACEGHSAFQTADKLNAEGVLPPSLYKQQCGSNLAMNGEARAIWTNGIISHILRDERYTGILIGGQHETTAVGSGKKRHTPKEAWIRTPGAIPAIISQEIWDELASKRQGFTNRKQPDTDRLLFKKVRCGYCGHVLQYVRKSPKPYYRCDTARYTGQHGCRTEIYRERVIIDTVKIALQAQISLMLDMEKLCRNAKKGLRKQAGDAQITAARLDGEITNLQALKRQLYERYKGGTLDRENFFREREAVEKEIGAKTAERDALMSDTNEQADVIVSAQQFLGSFLKYQSMTELPDDVVGGMVDTVHVYGAGRIEITFSFQDEWERVADALQHIA